LVAADSGHRAIRTGELPFSAEIAPPQNELDQFADGDCVDAL
jgi:hypothetical protein